MSEQVITQERRSAEFLESLKKSAVSDPPQKVDRRKTMAHLFKKGQSGNPLGPPKGLRDFTGEMIAAMRLVEKEQGISIMEHAWKRAMVNDKVLVALLRKVVADLPSDTGFKEAKQITIVYGDALQIGKLELKSANGEKLETKFRQIELKG